MRILVLALAATGVLTAQKPVSHFLIGRLTSISDNKIEVQDSVGTHVFYCGSASKIWRGKDYHDFSVLQVGDEVDIGYRLDAQSHAVVVKLWANIDKVGGRITRVGRDGFQVDENYSAPPDSSYLRGLRQIVYDSGTQWEESLPSDLTIGRDVLVVGLKLPNGALRATRVIVYEGQAPVRMKASRIVPPNGVAH